MKKDGHNPPRIYLAISTYVARRFAGYVFPLLGTLSEYRRRLVTLQQPPHRRHRCLSGAYGVSKRSPSSRAAATFTEGVTTPPPSRSPDPLRALALVAPLPLALLAVLLRVLAKARGPRT